MIITWKSITFLGSAILVNLRGVPVKKSPCIYVNCSMQDSHFHSTWSAQAKTSHSCFSTSKCQQASCQKSKIAIFMDLFWVRLRLHQRLGEQLAAPESRADGSDPQGYRGPFRIWPSMDWLPSVASHSDMIVQRFGRCVTQISSRAV